MMYVDWGQHTDLAFEDVQDEDESSWETPWEGSSSNNQDQYLFEDDNGEQDSEYMVELNAHQSAEMESGDDQYSAFLVDSNESVINGAHQREDFEDEGLWHKGAEEITGPVDEFRDLFISEERYISPGSTEISRALFNIRSVDEQHKFINQIKEVKLDSCGSVSLAYSKYLSNIKDCSQYNIPIVTLNGIGGSTLPITKAGVLTHVTPQRKLIKFLCHVSDTPIGKTQEMILLGLKTLVESNIDIRHHMKLSVVQGLTKMVRFLDRERQTDVHRRHVDLFHYDVDNINSLCNESAVDYYRGTTIF